MENVEEIGVLFFTDKMDGASLLEYAKRLEGCGVRTLWLPELMGREPFSNGGCLACEYRDAADRHRHCQCLRSRR